MMEIFTTMITPYTTERKIDFQTAEKYVDWYFESGIDGIFSVCQSSEIFELSLEERVKLNKVVYERAKYLEKKNKRKFTIISSGHVSNSLDEQAEELCEVFRSGCDALILITNRLDINNEGDEVFIRNGERLLGHLPSEARLGFYECPFPYKRLVTPKILDWCLSTDRFYYMKDTSCDMRIIKERIDILKGSHFKILNANCQTLLESIKSGCGGYCGIMCNFHPRLYAQLKTMKNGSEKAEILQSFLGSFGFVENGIPYPLSAKYNMSLCGIETRNIARNRKNEELTEYGKNCVWQMKRAADYLEKMLYEEEK